MWLLHFGLLEMSVSPPAILVSGTPTVTPYIEYYCNLTISLLKKKKYQMLKGTGRSVMMITRKHKPGLT